MKKRILCAILSLVAVFSLVGFNATEAWFSGGENKSMVLNSGDLDFTATGDLSLKDENAVILPGTTLELAEAIVITNNSTIDTELRICVECTYDGSTEVFQWIEFVNADGSSKWAVDENDGYIYYYPNGISKGTRIPGIEITTTEATTPATTAPENTTQEETSTDGAEAVSDGETEATTAETITEETTARVYAENDIPFAGTIKISGDVPPELIGKELTINFKIQAKQADFMEWQNFDNPFGMPTTTTTTTTTNVES